MVCYFPIPDWAYAFTNPEATVDASEMVSFTFTKTADGHIEFETVWYWRTEWPKEGKARPVAYDVLFYSCYDLSCTLYYVYDFTVFDSISITTHRRTVLTVYG